jgi:hypothetical protein
MNILLPGHSKRNLEWGLKMKESFNKMGSELKVIRYDHWESNESFNLEEESNKSLKLINRFENYNVISKSVGNKITANLLKDQKLHPDKLVLLGLPSSIIELENLKFLNPRKILVIQNINDPLMNYEKAKRFIETINPNIEIQKGNRDDHHYPYFDKIISFLNL